ncbi:unnamed protein product [Parajaminaea phylloscopi]
MSTSLSKMSSEDPARGNPTTATSTASAAAQSLSETANGAAEGALNAASDAAQSTANVAAKATDALAAGAAKALGSSAEEANEQRAEKPHAEIPKAHESEVPDRISEHPHMAAAPAIAEGDEERPSEPGLQDLGWSEDPKVPQPVIHGMRNEDMWVLVRRFNKQTYHLKALKDSPPGKLDMNIADADEFFPDKLRSTLERCYTTIGISMVALLTHVARIRSWKEYRRTAIFAVVYLLAWIFNYLVPTVAALALLLFVSPRSRRILFPPAPLAAISSKGTAQVPASGHLGSNDSATGAAESFKGEAVEQEASNLVSSISTVAVSTAVGKGAPAVDEDHPDDVEEDDADEAGSQATRVEESIPDPTKVAAVGAQAKDKAAGDKKLKVGDNTAAAVDNSVWGKMHPLLHALEDLCDNWERFQNALSPVPPFPQHRSRLFLASTLVLPLLLISLFVDVDMVYKGAGFGFGFAFFGQPLFDKLKVSAVKQWLDEHYPNWPALLQLRNTLLKGVPTNAQLTVTLLRIAEAAQSPLPPPPPAVAAPPPEAAQGKEMVQDVPPEYQSEMRDAAHHQENTQRSKAEEASDADTTSQKSKKKGGSKILGFFRGTVFAGTATVLGANKAKAAVGSQVSKNRLGAVKKNLQQEARGDGPSSFKARYKGKRGYVDVLTTAATPSVVFEPEWGAHAKAAQKALDAADSQAAGRDILEKAVEKARPKALWSVLVDDIAELRKVGGYGWKGKLVVGWAFNSEIADGLEITTVKGERIRFTAMPRRDEVFNRLASLGKQQWEIW